jgi:MFS family permease
MNRPRLAVSLIFFVCGFIYTSWSSRLPRLQDLLDMDNKTLGLMLLASAIGSLCSMPLTGWLTVRQGSRFATTLSVGLFCGSLLLLSLATTTWELFAAFWVVGVCTGALDVSMNAQAVLVEKQQDRPLMSTFHATFSVGMMVGALAGSLFIELSPSLFVHFGAAGLFCAILSVWAVRQLITDAPTPVDDQATSSFQLPSPALLALGLIAFSAMLSEGAMADWSTNYFKNVVGASEAAAPLGLTVFSGAMMAGRLMGDWARQRLGDRFLLRYGAALGAIGLALVLLIPLYPVSLAGLVVVGIGLSTLVPIVYSMAGHRTDYAPGVSLAMVTTVGYFGFLVGPPFIGFLADWQGLRLALGIVVVLLLATVIVSGLSQPVRTDPSVNVPSSSKMQ